MKKPMLNAIQKARMSMAMKSKNPKMNPGFDSLPKDVQAKIMKKKAKLSMKEPMMAMEKKPKMAMRKPKMSQPTASDFKNASRKTKRKIKRETKKQLKALKKLDKTFVDSAPKPKMAMKKPKMKSGKAMTSKEIKKANQEYGGKSYARMMKQIGKAEDAKDQGKKRKAKRLTKRVNRIAMRKPKASQTAGAIMKRERLML